MCSAGRFGASTANPPQSRRSWHSIGGAAVTRQPQNGPKIPVRRHRKPKSGKTPTWRRLCLSSFPPAETQTREAFIPSQPGGGSALGIGCYKFPSIIFSHKHFFFLPLSAVSHIQNLHVAGNHRINPWTARGEGSLVLGRRGGRAGFWGTHCSRLG